MRDTIDMARESWLDTYGLGKDHNSFVEALNRFAELVRADEREACAKVCEDMPAGLFSCDMNGRTVDGYVAQWKVAEDIRARGNT